MSISRRKFLLTSAVLNAAGYSTSAYACFYGFSFYFAPVPSSDFIVSSKDERSLDGFFDKKYGPNRWRYSSPSSFVRAPDIAENAAVIPVTIRLDDVEQVRQYQKIEVFIERIVDVLDAAKFDSTYLPSVYHVDGENWESKNHPNALQLRKITYPMSTMFMRWDSNWVSILYPKFQSAYATWTVEKCALLLHLFHPMPRKKSL